MPDDKNRQAGGQQPPSPPANTTALLGLAYMRLGHRIVAGVVAAGYPQRPAHSAVFAHIEVDGGTRLTTLAARANITPQAMGELVDDLERLGYVRRQPDPGDRRAKRIVLTPRGVACVAAAIRTIARLEADLEALLGTARLAELGDALGRIADANTPMTDNTQLKAKGS
ncbi:MAG: MarR family winged helix-turn-helix transcriptional regulator [Chloroflexota bacterium]|nr:MarR family winged helix-turn-helix transcriptional regulator [Chloroflexota bacterium]